MNLSPSSSLRLVPRAEPGAMPPPIEGRLMRRLRIMVMAPAHPIAGRVLELLRLLAGDPGVVWRVVLGEPLLSQIK